MYIFVVLINDHKKKYGGVFLLFLKRYRNNLFFVLFETFSSFGHTPKNHQYCKKVEQLKLFQ